MDHHAQNTAEVSIEPWPMGWPLPLAALYPGLPWEDAVEVYLAYQELMWGPVAEPAADEGIEHTPLERAA
jgi:hypothetical protein